MNSLASFPHGGVAIVFGASGGIGSALHAQIVRTGRFQHVLAFSRGSEPRFDLIDEDRIRNAVETGAALGPIRLVINAAGFLHDASQGPEKSLREIDADKLARCFALNAIGPALILKHGLAHLSPDGKSVMAMLSARVGSIGDNQLGGWYGYRASKAALNQFVRTAAIEVKRRRAQTICVALHPGTVGTGLSSPFVKQGLDVQTPEQSAARLLEVIENLTPEDTGSFFDHRGQPIPW